MNDDIVEVKTARDCARRWSHLLKAGAAVAAHSTNLDTNVVDDALFDCTDLIVPTSHELINREVELGIRRWHDLASRVIMDDNDGEEHQNHDDGDDEEERGTFTMIPPRLRENDKLVDATSGGDKRKQRLMPYKFDYACKCNNGPMIMTGEDNCNSNIHKRPRVISLLDPTQTLDYEYELYHTVFKPIQTLDELEQRYAFGREKIRTHAQVKRKMMTTTTVKQRPGRPSIAATSAATAAASPPEEKDTTTHTNISDDSGVMQLPHHGCQHTFAVKRNLREWFAKYSRIDAHSLGRLRVKDRHSAHPLLRSNNGSNTTTTTTYVRFEILRYSQNLKRGSGVDNSRLELELHGTQRTLLDLHHVIVESALNKEAEGVNSIDDNDNDDDNNTSAVNGIFFIENTFYTCGQVGIHVAEAITRWLDEDSDNKGEGSTTTLLTTSRRRKFLGMMPKPLLPTGGNSAATKILPMSVVKLEDLSFRLGVRYFHMYIPPPTPSSLCLLFQGQGHAEDDEESSSKTHSLWSLATESAVFVTGIQTIPSNTKSLSKKTEVNNERKDETGTKHPILFHDTWAALQRHICYACNNSPASVVTVNDELTDAAPPGLDERTNKIYLQGVPLCSSCYRAMHYCCHENNDDELRELTLRSSINYEAFLVFSIEEYDRLVTSSSLDDIPANSGF